MKLRLSRRVVGVLGGVALVLVGLVGLVALYQVLLHRLESTLLAQLGPRATLGALEVDWNGLTVRDLHVAAAPGWPAKEELSARRLFVQPELRSLVSGPWRIRRIEVDDASLSLLRTRDGRLRLLPGLLESSAPAPSAKATPTANIATVRTVSLTASAPDSVASTAPQPAADTLVIQEVQLYGVTVDVYDDSLRPARARPHHLQIDQLKATVGNLHLPALAEPVALTLAGRLRGADDAHPQDGQLTLAGALTPATRDADLQAELKGVDLRVLQPYLLKVADGGIQRGQLDLRLHAQVTHDHLRAPGQVVLTGLTLGRSGNWWDHLGTASRQAVLDTMARQGRIEVSFTLEGRLDDPNFSINDSLAKRFATGLADAAGVSVGGVVEGVGQMFKGLLGR